MNVPLNVLGEFRFAQGFRMPPRPKHFEKPRPTYNYGGYHSTKSDKGNLPFAEYRFFTGSAYPDVESATCKGCGEWMRHWNIKSDVERQLLRREHLEEKGCSKLLIEAYKLLLADKCCVVCGKRVRTSKWGVPLCKGDCQKEFMFGHSRPDALCAALAEVRKRDIEGRAGGRSEETETARDQRGSNEMASSAEFTDPSGAFWGELPYPNWLGD